MITNWILCAICHLNSPSFCIFVIHIYNIYKIYILGLHRPYTYIYYIMMYIYMYICNYVLSGRERVHTKSILQVTFSQDYITVIFISVYMYMYINLAFVACTAFDSCNCIYSGSSTVEDLPN